jgi:hypothetical protein
MDSLDGYTCDDDLAVGPLNDLGWDVEIVSWRRHADWNRFEAIVIRSTWDYQSDPQRFLRLLQDIESSRARLENSIEIVRWNLDKAYLREMQSAGVRVVPTIWDQKYSAASFSRWLTDLRTDEVIVKPTVSATAEHTYRLTSFDTKLAAIFSERTFMVQPFLPSIITEGEFSLFYFGGQFSHAILKSPKAADFRVQEEHGGIITAVTPSGDMLDTGRFVFDMIAPVPLYARVDLVRDANDKFALMELELIEPALYLRMDREAPGRFAAAIDQRMSHAR